MRAGSREAGEEAPVIVQARMRAAGSAVGQQRWEEGPRFWRDLEGRASTFADGTRGIKEGPRPFHLMELPSSATGKGGQENRVRAQTREVGDAPETPRERCHVDHQRSLKPWGVPTADPMNKPRVPSAKT